MPEVTHLALGNSLMAAGFDEASFDETVESFNDARSLNAALGSTWPTEHLLILRKALRKCPHLEFVIYGFFDFQLTDNDETHVADLIGNRAVSYYLEPKVALEFYSMPRLDQIAFQLYRRLPMMEDRVALWSRVELLRRKMQQIGMPQMQTDRFGRAADFTALEAASSRDFEDRCDQVIAKNIGLSRPIEEIIRESQSHHAQLILVEMPMHPSHQREFYSLGAWDRYRTHLLELLRRQGVVYVRASDWIPDSSDFADHLHMNSAGAAKFSRRLGAEFSHAALTGFSLH